MEYTRIGENNKSAFEEILFLENHTPKVPLIMLGALDEGQPVAATALELDGRIARLISVYVEKSHRRKGIGTGMVEKLISFSKGNGYDAFEVDFIPAEEVQGFLEHVGFHMFSGNEVLYLQMDEVIATKRFQRFLDNANKDLYCVPFSSLSNRQLRNVFQETGVLPDESMQKCIDTDSSGVLMTHSNQAVGYITLISYGSDLIITDLQTGSYGYAGVGNLFSHLYESLKGKWGRDFCIGFIGADDEKLKLLSEVAGDMIEFEHGENVIHGVM